MSFANPWMFLMLLPLGILFFVQLLRKPPTMIFSSLEIAEIKNRSSKIKFSGVHIPLLLETIAGLFLIIALARPQQGIETYKEQSEGLDIILALDISGSMETFDVDKSLMSNSRAISQGIQDNSMKPRVEVAKQELIKFIRKRPEDRIGLIVFSDEAFSTCPLTLDHDYLEANIKKIRIGMLGEMSGTNIASPLASAIPKLKDSKAKKRLLVLFTDGKNTVDAKITPAQSAEFAADFDIIVHTVGIGSDFAISKQPSPFGGYRLVQMSSEESFDERLLKKIARTTGGEYFTASDEEGFQKVMDKIDKLETVEQEQPRYLNYKEKYFSFLYLGMGFLLLSFIGKNSIWQRIP